MTTIVIKSVINTEAPLSIALPVAEGAMANKFGNFPIMTRGVDDDGNKLQTAYLPSTTIRGFLRRAIVIDAMRIAAANGKHYTLQKAYEDLIGQDAASESAQEIDLLKLLAQREANPIIDLFGIGLTLRSRLLVSHFVPQVNILPDVFTGVRKDLDDTEGVLEALNSSDRDEFLGRSDANSRRALAKSTVDDLERKIRKGKKDNSNVEDFEKALISAKELKEKYESAMGSMQNTSRTLVSHFALAAGISLKGKIIIENARDRDLPMIELALNTLSNRPLLGAQIARGCGEISAIFDVHVDGNLTKKISIGEWKPAIITELNQGNAN